MIGKFQNKYRIPSIRLQNWDYRWAGAYFITICTRNRECFFGEIDSGKMKLSPIGIIANVFWHEINNHAKNVKLDAFVVMPNHVHGILILNGDENYNDNKRDNVTGNVETGHALSLQQPDSQPQTIGQKRFQNIDKNSVSSIIGSYKSSVTKHAHRLGFNPVAVHKISILSQKNHRLSIKASYCQQITCCVIVLVFFSHLLWPLKKCDKRHRSAKTH